MKFATIDRSDRTFVIVCHKCPGWAEVRLERLSALVVKSDHDVLVHGVEARVARDTVQHYRSRHAQQIE